MSHTTATENVTFIHDGDLEGSNVRIVVPIEKVDVRAHTVEVEIPFADLKLLVAKWVRDMIIEAAEQADDNSVLLGRSAE